MKRRDVLTGVERFLAGVGPDLRQCRAGMVVHPASVTRDLAPSQVAVQQSPRVRLAALFGPQHGVRGEKQDDMVESDSFLDPLTGLPVHSLYGDVRKPSPEMLRDIDVLLFDLQDVGVRVYTFVWTMVLSMQACAEAGVRVVVLDRPNPIGGVLREGAVLSPGFESFVGMYPIPLRHGLTAGELARWINATCGIGCELDVIPCAGWRRGDWFDGTGLPFVLPSPNLPTFDSCVVYPGMVLLEGTNLSEGRGTTRPFELFGAPFLDPDRLVRALDGLQLPGVRFRACYFEPTFQKHASTLCGGAQIHVLDRNAFRPVETAIGTFRVIRDLSGDQFRWREPPYEYETERLPIDIIWGGDALRLGVDAGLGPEEILEPTKAGIRAFEAALDPYLLYD